MRKFVTVGCALTVACAGAPAKTDSAAIADSGVVSGPPAPVTAQPPAGDSTSPPASASARGSSSTGAPAPRPPSAGTTPPQSAAPSASDSVRGIVSVVGTSFEKRVMVAVSGTSRRVEITGPVASLIGHVAGTEVTVVGKPSGTKMEASSFVVRSVDGQPALDGVLKREGTALYLEAANGTRTRIVAPPPPFEGREGSRVWITGDPAKGIASFGFIDPPR